MDWPGKHLRCLVGPAEATLTVNQFKDAYEVYKFWEGRELRHPVVQTMLDRSVFKLTATMQLVHAHDEASWTYTADIAQLLEDKARGVGSSNVCEHVNNAMKNAKQAKGSMKFRRPQRSMAAAIAAHVLTCRYKFALPPQDIAVSRASVTLDGKAFGRKIDAPSIDIKGVASTKSKAAWLSPKPENFAISGGDIYVLKQAKEKEEPAIVADSIMSCICNYKYNLVIKKGDTRDGKSQWLYGLWHFAGSAGFGWPVTIEVVPGHKEMQVLRFAEDVSEHVPIVLSTWENVKARTVTWRSVSYQQHYCKKATWRHAIRAFVTSAEQDLQSIAAANGFWDLPLTTLQKVAHNIGVDITSATSLVDGLFTVCKEITKYNDDQVLDDCLAPRLEACPPQDNEVMDVLMDVDEAVSCLMRDEQHNFLQEQKHAKETLCATHVVHDEFRELIQKTHAAKVKKPKVARITILEDMEAMHEQKDVKKYFPKDTLVWKSRGSTTWYARVKGWPQEKSRSVRKWGQTRALHLLISMAWYQYSVLNGKKYSDMPVDNLVDLDTLLAS